MKSFKEFTNTISESKKSMYHFKLGRDTANPYWSGIMRKRHRIGGMTYTSTYHNGKLKFTRRMRSIIGKKRAK